MRIGDNRLISVDVRIIAASNENLKTLMEEGNFRQDPILPSEYASDQSAAIERTERRYPASSGGV